MKRSEAMDLAIEYCRQRRELWEKDRTLKEYDYLFETLSYPDLRNWAIAEQALADAILIANTPLGKALS